jgi:glycosyltransferase involved in cell wall biosynthesis
MKITILGSRGIPNRYGGFEAFAEQLSKRLVDRGHQVRVYCRAPFVRPDDVYDRRVERVILPTINTKHLDTPTHSFLSAVHVGFTDTEVIVMVNVANSLWAWIPRLFGKPVILNVDGLDRQRKKWGPFARAVLWCCELLSVLTPTRLVTDAQTVQDYYQHRYGKQSTMIGYGAEAPADPDSDVLARFRLKPREYCLYVARLEKENNPELVIREYNEAGMQWPLVIVGGNDYKPEYVEHLRSLAGPGVIFTGAVYGDGYWALQKNAGMFVFAGAVGGIHPALIEAMAAGNAVLYLDTPANRETAGDGGMPFVAESHDLGQKMVRLARSEPLRRQLSEQATALAQRLYSWDTVTERYQELCQQCLRK